MYDRTNVKIGLMHVITSIQNYQVKSWRKLHTRKHRKNEKRFLIEGFHLIEEAVNSGWEIEMVIVREGVDIPSTLVQQNITFVNTRVFKEISQTKTPQGIAAVVKMREFSNKDSKFVLLVDAVQDPGNLGTIIRTADAAGFSHVVLGQGTVDLYNDKVIRATQGSIFHISITQANLSEEIKTLQEKNYTIIASALENATDYRSVEVEGKAALIVGNEGTGIQKEMIQVVDKVVKIPIYGEAESLNVSIAAGILMYHMRN